jgi:hypothetical protein
MDPPMPILFRCPITGLDVHGFLVEENPSEDPDAYESVTCLSCGRRGRGKTEGDLWRQLSTLGHSEEEVRPRQPVPRESEHQAGCVNSKIDPVSASDASGRGCCGNQSVADGDMRVCCLLAPCVDLRMSARRSMTRLILCPVDSNLSCGRRQCLILSRVARSKRH